MSGRLRSARFLTDFDSSVNMVRSLGRFLKGKDHGGMSIGPASRILGDALSAPPRTIRRLAFNAQGMAQGIPLHRVRDVDAGEIAQWATAQYPSGPHPVVTVGSAGGAAVNLAAALHAPFLPHTVLVGVSDLATHPDEATDAMEALAPTVRTIAANNPEVSVYHMHDPAQDRPMLQGMAYMRLKRSRLGPVYERFLRRSLEPGGTIVLFECTRTWRTRAVGERAYFQFGCLGGVPEEEYHDTGERIADYLVMEGSHRRDWRPPEPDARRAEAEWGTDPSFADDVQRFADEHGYRLVRLECEEPQELSPTVAELFRWWYRDRGLPDDRLLVQCYVQWDPLWTQKLGAVPFWLRFNMEPSYEELERYLAAADPYAHIHLNLFSQGLTSPGVVPTDRWRRLVEERASEHGELIGVDTDAYPVDLGSTVRFQPAFRSIPSRVQPPERLTIAELDAFMTRGALDERVRWRVAAGAGAR